MKILSNNSLTVLLSSGCHNKTPEMGWLKTTDIYFLTVLEAGKSVVGVASWLRFWWELRIGWGCLPTTSSHGGECALLCLPLKWFSLLNQGPTLMTSSTFIISPNTVILGVRASHEFGRDTYLQSMTNILLEIILQVEIVQPVTDPPERSLYPVQLSPYLWRCVRPSPVFAEAGLQGLHTSPVWQSDKLTEKSW